jgi:hypothetical protein
MSGSGWIPRIGGCVPMRSGGRSLGTWRRSYPCSLWRGVVRYRSRRDAIPTTYLPTDAVPPAKTQGRTGPLQTNLWVHRKHHAPRRARFSPPRGRRRGCPARSGAPGWSGPLTRSESTASGSPTAKACPALPAVHSGHTPPTAAGAATSWPANHRPRLRASGVPQCHCLHGVVPLRCSLIPKSLSSRQGSLMIIDLTVGVFTGQRLVLRFGRPPANLLHGHPVSHCRAVGIACGDRRRSMRSGRGQRESARERSR